MFKTIATLLLCLLAPYSLKGQTIAEKKAGIVPPGGDLTRDMQAVLVQLNKEVRENQAELRLLYDNVMHLYETNAPEDSYRELLDRINFLRNEIGGLENSWRELVTETGHEGGYALWHQPETTLGQLVIDYGSQSYVYVMPPEVALIKISVNSNIPIPRSLWNEMMELILVQNGVGFKQLNPYLRQLFLLKQDRSSIQLITNSRRDLEFLPGDTRICFMLTPEPSEVRRAWAFLDKFINPNTTVLQMVGRDILIIAPVADVLDLLKLYDFVVANKGDKEYKIKPIFRVDAEEMAKVLGAIFDQFVETPKVMSTEKQGPPGPGNAPGPNRGGSNVEIRALSERRDASADVNGLKIIPLRHIAQAIFLVGTKEEIKKAEEIIDEVESRVGGAREKVIHWYTTRHSDPEDLAQILEKIYTLMITTGVGREPPRGPFPPGAGPPGGPPRPGMPPLLPGDQQAQSAFASTNINVPTPLPREYVFSPFAPSRLYQNDFYQQGGYVVNPTPVEPKPLVPPVANKGRNNFIVDLKTGAIVMVVEADILPKLKELIRKLDVPKRMVQIEALLFEKRLSRSDNFGLNLLRLGDLASNQNISSILWNNIILPTPQNPSPPNNTGILDLILDRKGSHGVPAFDIMYRFLISQEDVQINANPTVVTLNQVPAKIAIVDEISVNTGTLLFNTNGNTTPEAAFTRAQYGITIVVTPTIHFSDEKCPYDSDPPYVTLDTDITFDSIGGTNPQQPDVVRRHITNQVSIPDGQTVVIGGLRRKDTDDVRNFIPYLGEIPGFGKLFSTTTMQESNVEMIIFLTPKIISDPKNDFEILRADEMLKRPGDIPEFMCILREAEEMEKNRLYAGTMNVLFGRPPDRCVPNSVPLPSSGYPFGDSCGESMGEYDGR